VTFNPLNKGNSRNRRKMQSTHFHTVLEQVVVEVQATTQTGGAEWDRPLQDGRKAELEFLCLR